MRKFVKYIVCVAVVTLSLIISGEGRGVIYVGDTEPHNDATIAVTHNNYVLSAGVDNLFSEIFLRRISTSNYSNSIRQLPQIEGICGNYQIGNHNPSRVDLRRGQTDVGSRARSVATIRQLRI